MREAFVAKKKSPTQSVMFNITAIYDGPYGADLHVYVRGSWLISGASHMNQSFDDTSRFMRLGLFPIT